MERRGGLGFAVAAPFGIKRSVCVQRRSRPYVVVRARAGGEARLPDGEISRLCDSVLSGPHPHAGGKEVVKMLVSLASKGMADKVQRVIDKLEEPGCIHYMQLFKALVNSGDVEGALRRLQGLKQDGFQLNNHLYSYMFSTLGKHDMSDECTNLKGSLDREGWRLNVYAYNAYLDSCVRGNKVELAEVMLSEMKRGGIVPNRVTYNIMLHGYTDRADLKSALNLWSEMLAAGLEPDVLTYTSLVDGHVRCGRFSCALQLLDEMAARGIRPNGVTYSAILSGFGRVRKFREAVSFYERRGLKRLALTVQGYLGLIGSYCALGNVDAAHGVLDSMESRGVVANTAVYTLMFGTCARLRDHERATALMERFRKYGSGPALELYNSYLNVLTKLGQMDGALRTLDQMEADPAVGADQFSYNAIIFGYANLGDFSAVDAIMERMVQKGMECDAISYGIIFRAHARRNDAELAMGVLDRMDAAGVRPNRVVYNMVLDLHARRGDRDKMEQVFREMLDSGVDPDVVTFNTIISALGRDHDVDGSLRMLALMKQRGIAGDIVTYNALIHICGCTAQSTKARELFEEMQLRRVQPDRITYNTLIDALVKGKKYKEAAALFNEMCTGFNSAPEPDVVTFSSMMSMHGKDGNLRAAILLLKRMERYNLSPDLVTYNMLINISAKQCDLSQAQQFYRALTDRGLRPDEFTFHALLQAHANDGDVEGAFETAVKEMTRHRVPFDERTLALLSQLSTRSGNDERVLLGKYSRSSEHRNAARKLLHTLLESRSSAESEGAPALDA